MYLSSWFLVEVSQFSFSRLCNFILFPVGKLPGSSFLFCRLYCSFEHFTKFWLLPALFEPTLAKILLFFSLHQAYQFCLITLHILSIVHIFYVHWFDFLIIFHSFSTHQLSHFVLVVFTMVYLNLKDANSPYYWLNSNVSFVLELNLEKLSQNLQQGGTFYNNKLKPISYLKLHYHHNLNHWIHQII